MPTTLQIKRPKRSRLSQDDRRRQILEAAVKAYARQGVERAGHGDIAKRLNISTATIFNYFPTREALTLAVLNHVSETLLKAVSIPDINGAPRTQDTHAPHLLDEILNGFEQLIEARPDVIKVLLNWSVSFGPFVRPHYMRHQDAVLTLLHLALGGEIKGQQGERADARLIYAAAVSYATMKLDKSPPAVINTFTERVKRTLI